MGGSIPEQIKHGLICPVNFRLPVMSLRNGNAGNFEIIDTVPGGQGDVNKEDLKKVETASLARELHIVSHLQLGADICRSKSKKY